MFYVPDITRVKNRAEFYEHYKEVIILPSRDFSIPSNYKGRVIIDHITSYNPEKKEFQREEIIEHLELIRKHKEDKRCIFILPAVPADLELSYEMCERQFRVMDGAAFIIFDILTRHTQFVEKLAKRFAFCYAIKLMYAHTIPNKNKFKYHLFGNAEFMAGCENIGYRSYSNPEERKER